MPKNGCLLPKPISTTVLAAVAYSFFLLITNLLFINQAFSEDALVDLVNAQNQAGVVTHISIIDGDALTNSSGLVRVNLSAGDGNVQQNSAAAAHSQTFSSAAVSARQYTDMVSTDSSQLLSIGINDQAFSDAQGIIQINQSAGAGNAQFNGAAIAVAGVSAFAFVELNDEQLMTQASPTGSATTTGDQPDQHINVNLAPGAFKNASGVIQLNQAAGNNNRSANSFTMSASP